MCDNWLAVEYGDGKIERNIFVASEKEKTKFRYLLNEQARKYFYDKHLWLSVFKKPLLSSFTRLDRITCCFVFHYLTMVLNILYYNESFGFFQNSIQINLGLFNITTEQVIFINKNYFLFNSY